MRFCPQTVINVEQRHMLRMHENHTDPGFTSVHQLTSVKRVVFLSSVPDKNSCPSAFSVLFGLNADKIHSLYQSHDGKSTPGRWFSQRTGICKGNICSVLVIFTYIPLILSAIGYIFSTSSVERPSITRRMHKVENNTLSHKIIGQLMQ